MFDYNTELGMIRMYGIIGEYDDEISAVMLMEALDAMGGEDVTIFLKSPGGEIDDGLSMFGQIEQYPGEVTVEIDAQAASIATVFPMAADNVVMRRHSEMFVHDPWTIAIGNARAFRGVADYLDALAGEVANVYAERAQGSPEDWLAYMREETRFSAEEAVAIGLADKIVGKPPNEKKKKMQENAQPVASFKYACMANVLDKRRRLRKN